MAKVTVCFTLDSEKDAALVAWLDAQGKRRRSEAIRGVLAAHLESSAAVDVGTVHQAVLALSAEVCSKLEELSDRARALAGGVCLGDVYGVAGETRQAVLVLERKLSSGAVIVSGGEPEPEPDEPPDVAANLDALAAMG